MVTKTWDIKPAIPAEAVEQFGLPQLHAQLLYNRGIRRQDEIEPFLTADSRLLNDPMLLPDMGKAVSRLKQALDSHETIGVFGDFDADGITGTALLTVALRDLGATVVPYLPHRDDEGHGLNREAISFLKEQGVSLIITVDCGVTDVDEVSIASSLDIDTIITDHHSVMPDLPSACAVINAMRPDSVYPYRDLTGVGMSFKLVQALYDALGITWPEHLLEFVALGTVADVGPLKGENRFLVKKGIEMLNRSENPGIQALAATAGMKLGSLTTESLSFGLIPRINVAGRMGDPSISLRLLTASSLAMARELADDLEQKNFERRRLTEQGVQEALEQVSRNGAEIPSIIFVGSRKWSLGILGLIAAKLVDEFYRPVVAVAVGEDVSRASMRTIAEFDVIKSLRNNKDMLTRFGGHSQAAGFTIPTSSLRVLKQRLEEEADEVIVGKQLAPSIEIDCEVSPDVLASNFDFIQSLAPFGKGNPAPIFLTCNARVVEARQVGAQKTHLKMKVAHGRTVMDAIAFRQGDRISDTGDEIDLVYNIGLNTWGSQTKLQMTVVDFRKSV